MVPLTTFRSRIEAALVRIRPALELDGGDIALVDVDETSGLVKVQLTGACEGCHQSSNTMTMGVERVLRQLVPEVRIVEAV